MKPRNTHLERSSQLTSIPDDEVILLKLGTPTTSKLRRTRLFPEGG